MNREKGDGVSGVADWPSQSQDTRSSEEVVSEGRAESPQGISPRAMEFEIDGRTFTVNATDSIALRCGAASITLHHDGRIVLRGVHIVSHASGVNRIRGGSVELN